MGQRRGHVSEWTAQLICVQPVSVGQFERVARGPSGLWPHRLVWCVWAAAVQNKAATEMIDIDDVEQGDTAHSPFPVFPGEHRAQCARTFKNEITVE